MSKPELFQKWCERKKGETWSFEEVTVLLAEAVNIGESVGERVQFENTVKLLEEHFSLLKGVEVENVEHGFFLQGLEEAISVIKLNYYEGK